MSPARVAGLGRALCLAGAALGAMGLVGWPAGAPFLTTIVPGQPEMKLNTAVGLALTGVAGAVRHRERVRPALRWLSSALAIVALAIGLGTLAEYALGIDLHIDHLLFRATPEPYPGRPSPPTAPALALLAAAVLAIDARPRARARPSEWFALSAGLIAFVALLGAAFGAGPLYRLMHAPVTGVAVPTAIAMLCIMTGLLCERPHAGVMRQVVAAGPGGILLRRLVPAAILAPILIKLGVTWLLAFLGIDDASLFFATLVGFTTAFGLVLLFTTVPAINRAHAALESGRALVRALVEQAPDGIFVANLDGQYTDVNASGCRMLGYSRDEIVGTTIFDLLPPEEADRLLQSKQQLLGGGVHIAEWRLRHKDGTLLPVEVSGAILPDGRWLGMVRDISERERAREALRQAQERLELALRGADLGAWDWNVESGEMTTNRRWAEMRGYRPDEIKPHVATWTAAIHPEDWPRVQQLLADYFEGRTREYEVEYRVKTKSGAWIWVLDRGKVFASSPEGKPLRMVGTELDITPRKRLEEELRLAEAKASGIVSISADAIISIDEDQRITLFNRGAEKTFGYASAEALGAPLSMLIPERYREAHRDHVKRFAAGSEMARRAGERGAPIVGLRKNGDEFLADASLSKLQVGGRTILTVALRDVTVQTRIEREQRFLAAAGLILTSTLECEKMLSKIAELAVQELADCCIVDTVDGDGEVRRLKVACRDASQNEIAALLWRARPGGELLREAFAARHPVVMARVSPEDLAAISNDEEDLSALRAIGFASALVVPLLAHDKPLGQIVLGSTTPSRRYGPDDLELATDLGQRVSLAAENALLYQAARRAVLARDEVLGIVAHDLRNPLNSIVLQAQHLRRAGEEPERRTRRPAEVIERAADRMNRLIQDLLDVSRMEAGHLIIDQSRVPAAAVVADAVDAQRPLASPSSHELRIDLPRDLPEVWADRDRLLQVLENLIGNAIKFTAPGGRVTVGARGRDGAVVFWVSDSGAGIPPESVPHLFDRFWQARRGDRRGAGLGLPIVKGIVEAHGGDVWVESTPGRGTTFFFTIPAAPRREPWRPAPAPHGP